MKDRFKFRAWNTIVERFQYFDFKDLAKMDYEDIQWHILEFQECTGVKDKEGKLIYEGDIVEINDINALGYPRKRIGEVVYGYGDSYPAFYVYTTLGDAKDFTDDMKVIGNKFENKKLLVIDNTDEEE